MSLKNSPKMSQREKFELINSEVRSFYEYCKEAGISDEEMSIICRPLTNAVRKAYIKKWTRIFLVLVMVFAIGYTVSQTDTFQWHASAVARSVLIKLLPIWDWTPLYYNKCLIEKSQPQNLDNNIVSPTDCIACEAVKSIVRVSDTSYNEVFNHHLLRGAPVIVTDAYYDWSPSPKLNLTNLINNDDRLRDSVPCRILTNIRIGRQPMDLEEIASRITNTEIPSWFVHFQNCDIRAVKSFRILAPRPYFLSPHIPPSHFNWLVLSKNYDTHRYKYLELDVGLIIMSQLKGKNFIQLRPRSPCEDDCYTLNFELLEGETLVLGNSLWEFEYLPGKGDNLAMITETDWIES
ncbi:uncharacterized protein LOC115455729 [Manduca sexta]|uniref:Uncharacterized protein n=1 Tax=Manduca sexta TaxID=7130 RepID=A0A921YPJ5_MANSE|nr:uncharacterized protein LOC115455729 [Manduca sexta]KAG6443039.1 hypothetical protein O3G_MSEX002632 [Manduca sexta]